VNRGKRDITTIWILLS